MLNALVIINLIIGGFLLAGLVKPKVAFWMKKPTRLKIVVISFIGMIIIGMLANLTKDNSEINIERLNLAKEHIEEGKYSRAINILQKIEESDSLFAEATFLINKTNSLKKLLKSESNSIGVEKDPQNTVSVTTEKNVEIQDDSDNKETQAASNKDNLAFKMFDSIDEVIDYFGEHDVESNTYKVISEEPLRIQISPKVLPNDLPRVIKSLTNQDLIMISFFTLAHTDINEITIISVPAEYDLLNDKFIRFVEEYSITKTLTREAGLEYIKTELGISSYSELSGAKLNKLIYEDDPPSHAKTLLNYK